MAETVQRERYLERLRGWKDRTEAVKIITGMRRCGKSTLLAQFMEILRAEGLGDRIVHVNFESKSADGIRDHRDLNAFLESRMDPSERTYVFLDEIQRVEGWERTVNSLSVDYDADVYLTGSNAHMLSSELSTYLSGRYVEIKMLPLSFKEYLSLHPAGPEASVEKRFESYMAHGAIPMIDPDDPERAGEMLQGIYSTILRKDVSSRLGATDVRSLDEIVSFLMSNVGSVTSCASVAKEASLSPATVKRYVQGLEDAFLIYRARRYDVRGKALLKTTEKYYASDTGVRNAVLGGPADAGRVLENVVFLELLRRGYSVISGSHYGREIDFVAEKGGSRGYFQVALTILGDSVFEREVALLDSVPDSFPKTILTLDRIVRSPPNGIRATNVIDWLLEE
ncbi:MAG: ATP-binding protein [Candidatus Methanoplasma sp.]|jgi:predicted AAA+ superfamily ATPase|nr:ATP-binding protein [Candidatus Methanoplasma sp.]